MDKEEGKRKREDSWNVVIVNPCHNICVFILSWHKLEQENDGNIIHLMFAFKVLDCFMIFKLFNF